MDDWVGLEVIEGKEFPAGYGIETVELGLNDLRNERIGIQLGVAELAFTTLRDESRLDLISGVFESSGP